MNLITQVSRKETGNKGRGAFLRLREQRLFLTLSCSETQKKKKLGELQVEAAYAAQ